MNVISERLFNLQTEELQVGINEEKTVSAAAANVNDVKAAADLLYKGNTAKGLPEYKKALLTAAGQWQQLYVKLQPIAALGKTLERDRAKAPTELAPLIDQLLGRIEEKGRNIQDKMGELFEKAGDYKQAITCYMALYQGIPEAKRAGEKKLCEKIADLYFKIEDFKDSWLYYKTLLGSMPEDERYKNGGLGLRMCDVLEKLNDYRTELQLLQALHTALPGDGGITDRLNKVQKKTGVTGGGCRAAGTVVPQPAATWESTSRSGDPDQGVSPGTQRATQAGRTFSFGATTASGLRRPAAGRRRGARRGIPPGPRSLLRATRFPRGPC